MMYLKGGRVIQRTTRLQRCEAKRVGRLMRGAGCCGATSSTAHVVRRSLPALWTASDLAVECRIPRRSASAYQSLRVNGEPTLIENENPTARGGADSAAAGFASNKAALALELGMTPGRVNCCMSGRGFLNERSCLRLTNITRGAAVAVFRLAGDTKSAAHATRVHCPMGELAGRLRQWPHRPGGWSVTEPASALSVLDVVVEALSAPRRKRTPPGVAERRAPCGRGGPSVGALPCQSFPSLHADPRQTSVEPVGGSSGCQRPRLRRIPGDRPHQLRRTPRVRNSACNRAEYISVFLIQPKMVARSRASVRRTHGKSDEKPVAVAFTPAHTRDDLADPNCTGV
jgi:hypothetical protein